MKQDLTARLSDIQKSKGERCLLLFGDELQIQEACKTIIDFLVPEQQRGFNLERFDGRFVPWEHVHGSLMTPPFIPGTKLIWIENAPYFISRDQKGEIGDKILQLWNDGKPDEAAKLLIDLLVVEEWTQEQWERTDPTSASELFQLLSPVDHQSREEFSALLAFCKSLDIDLSRRRKPETQGLAELLRNGLPEWSFLLLTAAQVDRRMRLYKRLEDSKAVIHLGVERDRTGNISRESVLAFVQKRCLEAGKVIEPKARELILQRAGSDLRRLSQELEKLFLHAGEAELIRVGDVEAIFSDQGEGWVFDLTRAIGEGDSRRALSQLARLVSRGEHPLRILGVLASEARRLLAARQLLDTELRGQWRRGMSYPQFQQQVLPRSGALLSRNPYGDYMCLLRAEQLSVIELRMYLNDIYDADLRLKSSGNNPRMIIERVVLRMCLSGAETASEASRA